MPSKNHNLEPLFARVRDAKSKIEQKEKTRSQLNSEIESIRDELEANGIGRRAFKMAMDYIDMTTDQRRSFDLAYLIVKQALGAPEQADLVDMLDNMTPDDLVDSASEDAQDQAA